MACKYRRGAERVFHSRELLPESEGNNKDEPQCQGDDDSFIASGDICGINDWGLLVGGLETTRGHARASIMGRTSA